MSNKVNDTTLSKKDKLNYDLVLKKRNMGFCAHVDSGKTTTVERILYVSGFNTRMGEVHDGNTTTDFSEQEKDRGITINVAAIQTQWKDHYISILDSPGHTDFFIEVERSLRILDGMVCLFDGVEGVQAQTPVVWQHAAKYNVSRLIFVNKLDRIGSNFFYVIKTIKQKLSDKILILHLPVGQEKEFDGIIDLIDNKFYHYYNNRFVDYKLLNVPHDMIDIVKKYRVKLVSNLMDYMNDFGKSEIYQQLEHKIHKFIELQMSAASNDEILNIFSANEIKFMVRFLTVNNICYPILCGASYKNIGIQNLLNAIIDFLPSPMDTKLITAYNFKDKLPIEIKIGIKGKFIGFVFKVIKDERSRYLSFIRIYSGHINKGDYIVCSRNNKSIRVSRLIKILANNYEDIDYAQVGDIVAIMGKSDLINGDTITGKSSDRLYLESFAVPPKVISMELIPATNNDINTLISDLSELKASDPSFGVSFDQAGKNNSNSGNIVISGMGTLHLDTKIHLLKKRSKFTTAEPMVAYKETIAKKIILCHEHKKQTGGRGEYAVLNLTFEPIDINKPVEFVDATVGTNVSKELAECAGTGILSAAANGGSINKSPVTGVRVTLTDGKSHEVDSSNQVFWLAGKNAFLQAMRQAESVLIEPIMHVVFNNVSGGNINKVEILARKKRGVIDYGSNDIDNKIINTYIPLKNTFGLIDELRSVTSGESGFIIKFHKYQPAPKDIMQEIINKNN